MVSKQFKVIAAFKNLDNVIPCWINSDRLGMLYREKSSELSFHSKLSVIPVILTYWEDFQDVKMVIIPFIPFPKHLRENSTIYRISMADLIDKKAQESLINVSCQKNQFKSQDGEHKTIVQQKTVPPQSNGVLDNFLCWIIIFWR